MAGEAQLDPHAVFATRFGFPESPVAVQIGDLGKARSFQCLCYAARIEQLSAQGTHFARWGSIRSDRSGGTVGSDNLGAGRLAGVCAGLAQRYGMSATTVRLLFIVSTLIPGPQFLVYAVLWALSPASE